MARNPKPVRRRYKAAHAAIRRGVYKYPPPTYDDLNDQKFAAVSYRVRCAATVAAKRVNESFRGLRIGLARAVEQVKSAVRGVPTRDDYRLVE